MVLEMRLYYFFKTTVNGKQYVLFLLERYHFRNNIYYSGEIQQNDWNEYNNEFLIITFLHRFIYL